MRARVDRRVRDARFPELNTVDGLRLRLRCRPQETPCSLPGAPRSRVPRQGVNPLFIGIPGTGKTFLAVHLPIVPARQHGRVVFTSATRMVNDSPAQEIHASSRRASVATVGPTLVIDDFAGLAMDPAQANSRFQSSPTATITSLRPASRPIACSRTDPRCSPTPLNAQVMPSGSPSRAERFICEERLSTNDAFHLTSSSCRTERHAPPRLVSRSEATPCTLAAPRSGEEPSPRHRWSLVTGDPGGLGTHARRW